MKILIADDHDLFRDSMAALLREQDVDIDVTLAANVGVAMYAIQSKKGFDVIVLDICMPGMNGLEGAKDLKVKVGDTPVILMSGSTNPALSSQARSIGLQGFLPKTLSGKSLLYALKLVSSGENFFSDRRTQAITGTPVSSIPLPDFSSTEYPTTVYNRKTI